MSRPKAITALASLLLLLAAGCQGPGPAGDVMVAGQTPAGVHYDAIGEGPPVVLIHAFGVDRRMWAPQVDALRGSHRVIRFDLRSHGQSVSAEQPYQGWQDLRDVLDEVGVQRAALVGLSAGASLALDFALQQPGRVSGLVLCSPSVGGYRPEEPPDMSWFAPVIEAVREGDARKAAELWAQTPVMTVEGSARHAALVERLVLDNQQLWSMPDNAEQPLDPPAAERLGELGVPVLVIVGERDVPETRRVAELIEASVSGSRLLSLPRAGHLVNLDAPSTVDGVLSIWLSSLPRAP
jgi:pimeloyl-ACP methyl ester carboxylesterase